LKKGLIFLLVIVGLLFGCKWDQRGIPENNTGLIPDGARVIKDYDDPITMAWDYTPEEGVTEYSFEFLMCLAVDERVEANITIVGTTTTPEYGPFTLQELSVSDVIVFGVRATADGISSEAIWTDREEDTEGGTFYADTNGLWLYNTPGNIGIQ